MSDQLIEQKVSLSKYINPLKILAKNMVKCQKRVKRIFYDTKSKLKKVCLSSYLFVRYKKYRGFDIGKFRN